MMIYDDMTKEKVAWIISFLKICGLYKNHTQVERQVKTHWAAAGVPYESGRPRLLFLLHIPSHHDDDDDVTIGAKST